MYVREVADQTLTFQVSGKLWMRSLVMRDLETGSEWAHLLGKSMAGEHKGHVLKPVITDMVTWAVWKEQHPETTILNMPSRIDRFTSDFYSKPSDFVFGFEVNGQARTLPLQQMMKHPVHQFEVAGIPLLATFDRRGMVAHLFLPQLDGRNLSFTAVDEHTMTDQQTNSRWNVLNGRCLDGPLKGNMLKQRVGIMSFKTAWQNFHPDSTNVPF